MLHSVRCSVQSGEIYLGGLVGGRTPVGRLRSAESQSGGGNAMRQNSGEGSANSAPTSALFPSFRPMIVTAEGSSSAVLGLTMAISCPRTTGCPNRTRQPFALTDTVVV